MRDVVADGAMPGPHDGSIARMSLSGQVWNKCGHRCGPSMFEWRYPIENNYNNIKIGRLL